MLALFKTTLPLALAIILTVVGMLVPAHLRSLDRQVVEAAAHDGQALQTVFEESVTAAHLGPTLLMRSATQAEGSISNELAGRIEMLQEERPVYWLSGGADRALEAFLKLVQSEASPTEAGRPHPILPQLLPRSQRASLSGMLESSSNANVAALLEARDISGLTRLHPASHAAGAPYDGGILTLALLIEGGHFRPAIARQIGQIATQAELGTRPAVAALEDFTIATLSLGRQLDFRSLADLAAITESPNDWGRMATLFRAQPERAAQLYAALRFSGAVDPVFDYLAKHPESGADDLAVALQNGPQATRELLQATLSIYRPKGLAALIQPYLVDYQPPGLIEWTRQHRETALALKLGLFLLAGFAFALAMGAAWRAGMHEIRPVSRTLPSVFARNFFLSLVVGLTLWTFLEPDLLKSQNKSLSETGPRIEFAVADSLASLKSPVKAMQELDQVTLLVLVLFFILQLVIYCFCLIKLKEIGKQRLSPALKLKLLDNEENLFDFGLYVGLGGTVLALILVAVGVVEASLMAAYASTLFGILFTAALKVLNLRPYRRRLIMEAGADNQSHRDPENLMTNIKL
ncbi:MAG: hypothetical protein GVY36_13720 [Verrucomicrobia bacterium]|jgi:hypothetical protein|nr:hypothetical protein [Verrucomicrobiota bacterium]